MHQWYDGSLRPFQLRRVWHLEPSTTDPDTLYAGVEDAALFCSRDAGASWQELSALRRHGTSPSWQPGAGGMCLHSILLDPIVAGRIFVAISAARVFRSDDGGESFRPINRGLRSGHIPDPLAEVGHCVHHITHHRHRPETLCMQKHGGVLRSDDAGESWRLVSGNLPSDFGFPVAVHAHEPETIYVVPITSDALHYPPEGRLRVYRSRTGGEEWEPLTSGLPEENCYVNVLRDAMAVDEAAECGIYFVRPVASSTARLIAATTGPRSCAIYPRSCRSRPRPSRERLASVIRVTLSTQLATLAQIEREVEIEVDLPVTQAGVIDALERRYPMLRGTIRDPATAKRRPFIRFFACGEDLSHEPADAPLPREVAEGRATFIILGAIAGG
jgi:hypothetical protein